MDTNDEARLRVVEMVQNNPGIKSQKIADCLGVPTEFVTGIRTDTTRRRFLDRHGGKKKQHKPGAPQMWPVVIRVTAQYFLHMRHGAIKHGCTVEDYATALLNDSIAEEIEGGAQ